MDGPMSEAASCPPVLPMALRKALPKFNISSGLKTGERSRADGDVLAPAPSLTPQAQCDSVMAQAKPSHDDGAANHGLRTQRQLRPVLVNSLNAKVPMSTQM